MARIQSLNILLEEEGKDYLAELYGQVIENVEKGTISGLLKNTDLSGNPVSGTVEAKRFAFAQEQPYGTARAAGAGEKIVARPVTVPIDQDKELVSEIENKDTSLYGVEGLLERRSAEHTASMIRALEKAFFAKAAEDATIITGTAIDPQGMFEEEVLAIETTKNDFVNGVPRSMIHIVKTPQEYSKLRQFINTDVNNANVLSNVEEFGMLNGAYVYSSIDLPAGVNTIAMCVGAIAQPVLPKGYEAEKIPLSNAYALELFYSYGTKSVMPELIFKRVAETPTPDEDVVGVSLDDNDLTLTVGGDSGELNATIYPANATNKDVEFTTSNEAVATVAADEEDPLKAIVTPVGAGSCTITVTTDDGGFTDTCEVTVEAGA
jgi:hypothetical protein